MKTTLKTLIPIYGIQFIDINKPLLGIFLQVLSLHFVLAITVLTIVPCITK